MTDVPVGYAQSLSRDTGALLALAIKPNQAPGFIFEINKMRPFHDVFIQSRLLPF
jgi:hypothetical protein